MADASLTKVEAAIKTALEAYGDLSAFTVLTDQPNDVALEDSQLDALIIKTAAYVIDPAFEGSQAKHTATIDVEAVTKSASAVISKANAAALAHAHKALTDDRTLGGMLQDIQEQDVAPTEEGRGRNAGAASLRLQVQWFTPQGDWFTIIGAGGATF